MKEKWKKRRKAEKQENRKGKKQIDRIFENQNHSKQVKKVASNKKKKQQTSKNQTVQALFITDPSGHPLLAKLGPGGTDSPCFGMGQDCLWDSEEQHRK